MIFHETVSPIQTGSISTNRSKHQMDEGTKSSIHVVKVCHRMIISSAIDSLKVKVQEMFLNRWMLYLGCRDQDWKGEGIKFSAFFFEQQ